LYYNKRVCILSIKDPLAPDLYIEERNLCKRIQGGKKMKSYIAKPQEIERKWYVVDAAGKPLGRVASQVASILRGKNKPIFTPNVDTGDFVIIINAEKVVLTGKKLDQKMLRHHSLYPGGLKETPYREALSKKPEFVFEEAVRRMLPKGVLGRQMLKKLKVYRGAEHNNAAQKPEVLELRY
jgi:large subunit ribosomal protein L13